MGRWTRRVGAVLVNTHERVVPGPLATSAALLAAIATESGPWPRDRWWPLELDRGLEVGSRGGHGPVRYRVDAYHPGESLTFRFPPRGRLVGWHGFDLTEAATGVVWRHTLALTPPWLVRFVVLPLHDAVLEDLLDTAEALAGGGPVRRRPLSLRVRVLRRAGVVLGRRPMP